MSAKSEAPSVRQCVEHIRDGAMTSESWVKQCLANIDASDNDVKAWTCVQADAAIERAQLLDQRRKQGFPIGKLHGVPVGIKDIVDTVAMPTERGSSIYAGRQPDTDAALIEKLHEAGAIILGKTVTTEFAWMNESHTRNPFNLAHTPGGSSSGSAAAVAAGHVPLAVGTQTGGSVIRPASFNGVFGYKPSFGTVSRRGVLQTSPSLDQPGVFGRDLSDVCLMVDAIKGYDPLDSATRSLPYPALMEGYDAQVPVEPNFVWIDMPYADRYSESIKDGFIEFLDFIENDTKASLDRIPAPVSFQALTECHQIIYDVEILQALDTEWNHHRDALSESAQGGLTRAMKRSSDEYEEAVGIKDAASVWFNTFFNDFDAVLTPAAVSEAPLIGSGTGDPACCVIWTLCGLPCISMPLMTGSNQLPMGVQLVGSFDRDDRLFRTGRWLLDQLNESEQ